jgi:hypothetical protein
MTENFKDGPFLQASLLCQDTIQDKDNTFSVIRIADQLNIRVSKKLESGEWPPVPQLLRFFFSLKAGKARGDYKVTIIPKKPKPGGSELRHGSFTINFSKGDNEAVYLPFNIKITLDQPGFWSFDVLVNDTFITRTILEVRFHLPTAGEATMEKA